MLRVLLVVDLVLSLLLVHLHLLHLLLLLLLLLHLLLKHLLLLLLLEHLLLLLLLLHLRVLLRHDRLGGMAPLDWVLAVRRDGRLLQRRLDQSRVLHGGGDGVEHASCRHRHLLGMRTGP